MDGFFGSDGQRALARRALSLHALLRDDARLTWYGRGVGLADWTGELDLLEHLARVQGASTAYRVRRDEAAGIIGELSRHGLSHDIFGYTVSGDDALNLARETMRGRPLPPDLTVVRIDGESPPEDVADLARVALDAGVLPPPEPVLRGALRRGAVLLARDAGGRPVATAAAIESFHPDGGFGDMSWWGMLATDPSRRGEGIALVLGARAMLIQHEEFGHRRFVTGVRDDNAASLALCAKLGVRPTDMLMLMALDRESFGEGRLTS